MELVGAEYAQIMDFAINAYHHTTDN